MSGFIEVIGVGRYTETIVNYRASMTLEVNSVWVETAVREVTELRSECVRRIRESGITEEELREGGIEVSRPWSFVAEKKSDTHDAQQRPDGTYAYRVRAVLHDATSQRVGLKGTAKVSGSWVPAVYWVLRRPLSVLRQTLGW